jgi:hypothetical protein
MSRTGVCSLCLHYGKLTFEHVPPRRAFNSGSAVAHTLYGLASGSKHGKPPPLLNRPAGLGQRSLCERCNNITGSYYGDAFADWTIQCLRYAERIKASSEIVLSFRLQPLNVLKQIATMIIAVSGSKANGEWLDVLRAFVLSPQLMALPTGVVVAAYLNPVDPLRVKVPLLTQNRLSGSCAVLDVQIGASVFVLGEVAFPPMGYVAYHAGDGARVSNDFGSLCDLRGFSNYRYGREASIFIQMPARFPFGPVPGYYPNLRQPGGTQYLDDNHVVITA